MLVLVAGCIAPIGEVQGSALVESERGAMALAERCILHPWGCGGGRRAGLGPGRVGVDPGQALGAEGGSGIGDSALDALDGDGGGNRDVESDAKDGDGDPVRAGPDPETRGPLRQGRARGRFRRRVA